MRKFSSADLVKQIVEIATLAPEKRALRVPKAVAGRREVVSRRRAATRSIIDAHMQNENVTSNVEVETFLDDQIKLTTREAAHSDQKRCRPRQGLKRMEHQVAKQL